MITNFDSIKRLLESEGIHPISQTDTELVVLLVRYLKDKEGLSTFDAFKKAFEMCEGSNTIVLMDKTTPNKLYCVKSVSPLWVGQLPDEKGYIVASEVAVF